MKHILLTIIVLAMVSLVACSIQAHTLTQTTASKMATDSPDVSNMPEPTSLPATTSNAAEETEVRNLVENFGKRLQMVPLLAPDAAQELQKQYSELVSPALLEIWLTDISKAPGRMVSSPWTDRIEITTLSKKDSDKYEVTGFLVEVTSTEVGGGEAAAKIPIRLVVQREEGVWLITEYAEEQ